MSKDPDVLNLTKGSVSDERPVSGNISLITIRKWGALFVRILLVPKPRLLKKVITLCTKVPSNSPEGWFSS